jgi:hypothetical protein
MRSGSCRTACGRRGNAGAHGVCAPSNSPQQQEEWRRTTAVRVPRSWTRAACVRMRAALLGAAAPLCHFLGATSLRCAPRQRGLHARTLRHTQLPAQARRLGRANSWLTTAAGWGGGAAASCGLAIGAALRALRALCASHPSPPSLSIPPVAALQLRDCFSSVCPARRCVRAAPRALRPLQKL